MTFARIASLICFAIAFVMSFFGDYERASFLMGLACYNVLISKWGEE